LRLGTLAAAHTLTRRSKGAPAQDPTLRKIKIEKCKIKCSKLNSFSSYLFEKNPYLRKYSRYNNNVIVIYESTVEFVLRDEAIS